MMVKLPKIMRPKQRSASGVEDPPSSSPLGSPYAKIVPKKGAAASASTSKSGSSSSSKAALPISSCSSSSDLKSELEAVFRLFDANGDGRICVSELGAVLNCLGDPPDDEELHKMIAEVDSDGDGFISLEEFLRFHGESAASTAELKAAFYVFDIDRNGFISVDELHKVLVGLGDTSLTMEDCGQMIRGVDSNGDGRVDFEEFKLMMASA